MSAMGASCSMVGFSDSECAGRRCLAERRCPRSARLLRYGHSASVLRALMLPAKDVVFAEHNDSDSAIAVIWRHHIMARVVPTAVALSTGFLFQKPDGARWFAAHILFNDQAVRAVKDDFDGREIVSVQFPTAGADNWATRDATYCGTTGWNLAYDIHSVSIDVSAVAIDEPALLRHGIRHVSPRERGDPWRGVLPSAALHRQRPRLRPWGPWTGEESPGLARLSRVASTSTTSRPGSCDTATRSSSRRTSSASPAIFASRWTCSRRSSHRELG